jgi:GNAT superfamily N-acetyltransferase
MAKYSFFRINSGDSPYFKNALLLLNKILGEDLYAPDVLRNIVGSDDSLVLGCTTTDEQLVGVAMAGELNERGINFYAPFGEQALQLLRTNKIGVMRNSAVESEFRGQGIGSSFLAERLKWAQSRNCNYAVGLTWLHGSSGQSDYLYRSAMFQQIGPVCQEFFVSLSESTGMKCPYCGFPCRCSAAMYAKKL